MSALQSLCHSQSALQTLLLHENNFINGKAINEGQGRTQKTQSTVQEAENFLKPRMLCRFYVALVDIVQTHILCSLGVENPCAHK